MDATVVGTGVEYVTEVAGIVSGQHVGQVVHPAAENPTDGAVAGVEAVAHPVVLVALSGEEKGDAGSRCLCGQLAVAQAFDPCVGVAGFRRGDHQGAAVGQLGA